MAESLASNGTVPPVSIEHFPDNSFIQRYADGSLLIGAIPPNGNDPQPFPAPQAWLYYWNIIRNRPDIKTMEQVMRANKEDDD